MTKTRSLTAIIVICFLASILFHTLFSFAEQLTFTAYYPSPNAFYNNLNTTNLKVDNDAFVLGSLGVGTPLGDTASDISVVKPTDAATLLLFGASDVTDPNSNYANLILASPASTGNEDPYMWGIVHSSQVGFEHKLGYVYHGSGNYDTTTTPPTPIFINVLTMDTDGDVGINTTDPQAALHVAGGNAIFEGNVGIGTTEDPQQSLYVLGSRIRFEGRSPTGPGSPSVQFREENSDNYWVMTKRGSRYAPGSTSYADQLLFSYYNHTAGLWKEHMRFDTKNNVLFGNNGNVTMRGAGRLGIGRYNARGRIDVSSANELPAIYIQGNNDNIWFDDGQVRMTTHDGTGNWQIKTGADNDDNYFGAGSGAAKIQMDEIGRVWIRTAPAGTAGNPITWNTGLVQTSNGNVGIGTTTPNRKLHVIGDATISGSLRGRVMGGVEIVKSHNSQSCWGGRYRWGAATRSGCNVACNRGTLRTISSGECYSGDSHGYCYSYLCIE